ncbi:Txe/YoeB family addiction module toxin [Nostoc sp.]|uniref:Txe/YoeB family addiction module toxin n=1 Tax=Nostoc sp. TaxID=1180 RepID=UPI003FA52C12
MTEYSSYSALSTQHSALSTEYGKSEALKYMDADIWSRRIDLEHRLVYRVGNAQIDFLTCRYHYE